MKTTLFLSFLIIFAGCQSNSKIELPVKGDGVQVLHGKVADVYGQTMVVNAKTAQGRVNDAFDSLRKTTPLLMLTLVGGLIFWGITRSKFGWVIPVSALAGIILIMTFAQWSAWITGGVLVVALGLLIWKAYEYQSERNKESLKNKVQ